MNRRANETDLNDAILSELRAQWIGVALLYLALWLAAYQWLGRVWTPDAASRWRLLASGVMALELGIVWHNLRLNHPPDGIRLLDRFGVGNMLTLLRGMILGLLSGFLFVPRPTGLLAWLPAWLYTISRLIDLLDGYAARTLGHESKLGAILDIEFDGLGVLIAIALGIQYGLLPIWFLPLALSRQLFVVGMWWRTRQGKPNYALPPSDNRRLIAGYQTGFLTVILWPLFSPPTSTLASILFAIPLFFSFSRDWLVVSGVLTEDSEFYGRLRRRIKGFFEGWLPLFARISALPLAVAILWQEFPNFPQWRPYFQELGMSDRSECLILLTCCFTIGLLCFVFGVVGRVAGLLLITLACLDIWSGAFEPTGNALLLTLAIVVAHLGSGKFALWQPEERLLRIQLGARESAA